MSSPVDLTNYPPAYLKCITTMVLAGADWLKTQPDGIDFEFANFDANPGVAVTGDLDEKNICYFGRNENARALLRVMDSASEHQATLLMAQAAIAVLLRRDKTRDD